MSPWIAAVALLAGFAVYLAWRSGGQRQARSALASHAPVEERDVRPTSHPPAGQILQLGPRTHRYDRTRVTFTPDSAEKSLKQMPQVKTIVAVSIGTIRRAETRIAACEQCDRTADTRFDCVLASLTSTPVQGIEYVMAEPARCPACGGAVFEHTLVSFITL